MSNFLTATPEFDVNVFVFIFLVLPKQKHQTCGETLKFIKFGSIDFSTITC